MKIKFKATHQLVTNFFTFLLLLKYKNDFPVVINLPQHFAATISGKLCRHVFSGVSHNVHIAGFKRLVVAWCEQHGNPSIVLTECERKDHFKHILIGKNQIAVFQLGTFLLQKVETGEGIKLTWNIWQSHETAYMAGIQFVCCGFSVILVDV